MITDEEVLCCRTCDLPPSWLPRSGAVPMDRDALFQALSHVEPRWIPRHAAEPDPGFKQWIPYVLVADPQGHWAAYPRRGSESRLHGLWSLGVGGHVNRQDADGSSLPTDWKKAWTVSIESGLRRELAEEFPAIGAVEPSFLGLIHESLTPVGSVHIGVVYGCRCRVHPGAPAAELAGLVWLAREHIGSARWPLDRFELWSQLALQLADARFS